MFTHYDATLSRLVDDHGETLIVRNFNGFNALVDPVLQGVVVYVPNGRRANLVEFQPACIGRSYGRNPEVVVSRYDGVVSFHFIHHNDLHVLLQELPEGQRVDVMPTADPVCAYAVVLSPLPVLKGAAAAELQCVCAV